MKEIPLSRGMVALVDDEDHEWLSFHKWSYHPLDNRRENLRLVVHAQNARNQRLRPHSSRFKGVTFNRELGRWHAGIMVDYRRIYLGTFDSEEEAALAYDQASRELQGEYGRPNFARAAGSRGRPAGWPTEAVSDAGHGGWPGALTGLPVGRVGG